MLESRRVIVMNNELIKHSDIDLEEMNVQMLMEGITEWAQDKAEEQVQQTNACHNEYDNSE